jgi:hypothetical protein
MERFFSSCWAVIQGNIMVAPESIPSVWRMEMRDFIV